MEKANKPNLGHIAMAMDIVMDMPLDARVGVSNLEEDEIRVLELTLGKYVKYRLDRLKSVGGWGSEDTDSADEVNEVTGILRYVWQILRKTHRLRIVK